MPFCQEPRRDSAEGFPSEETPDTTTELVKLRHYQILHTLVNFLADVHKSFIYKLFGMPYGHSVNSDLGSNLYGSLILYFWT